jgi:cysteinyl-tRNA synthetase
MKLFNNRTKRIDPFQPTGNEVAVLVCGPKLDEAMHLNQMFTFCAADVLVRYLESKGWPVRYAQSIINIEEDIPKKEQTVSGVRRSPRDGNIGRFIEDMQSLNVRPPHYLFSPTVDCSEQAAQYLGKTIDIHIGDADSHLHGDRLELPPAEDSNRQNPSARFWLQTNAENQGTEESGNWPDNLVTVAKLEAALTAVSSGQRPINVAPAQNRFRAAMDNDLDTAKGIATLLNLADEVLFRAPNACQVDEAQAELRRMASVFGLRLDQNGALFEERSIDGWNKHRQHFEESWA